MALADVKVQAEDGGQVFAAHKIVLCLRSPYLRQVLLAASEGAVVKVEGLAETLVLQEVRILGMMGVALLSALVVLGFVLDLQQ